MREMKDSGVEWIGEIPKEWGIVSLKKLFSFNKGLPITKADLTVVGIPVVSYGQIHSKKNDSLHITKDLVRYVPDDYLKTNPQSLVVKGDILFADTSEDYSGIGNCLLINADGNLFAGYHTIIARPSNPVFSKYLTLLFQTDGWRTQLRNRASGIKVFSITQRMLNTVSIILPTIIEGQRIADYLDAKCAQIDAIIARQQEIIEKLKAYKLSMITEAVTKGLDPDVPMKDSGVEWIGCVPTDWSIYRIANLYNEVSEKGNDNLPILTVSINTGVSDYELSDDESERVFVRSDDKSKYKCVQPGDLTYNMMRAWQGAFGAVRVNGMVSPAYIVARPKSKIDIDSRYMEYLLRTPIATEEMHRYSHGIADFRLRLYWPKFKNICVCLPSLIEQQTIANIIDSKLSMIDRQVKQTQLAIDKLIEYKKSLIYEVVTGKKEV